MPKKIQKSDNDKQLPRTISATKDQWMEWKAASRRAGKALSCWAREILEKEAAR